MSFKQPHRPQATRPRTAHRPRGSPTGHPAPHRPQATRPRTAHRPRGSPTGHPAPHRPQATRKGWPYDRQLLHRRHERLVYSRATPCGWPAARSHWLPLPPLGPPLAGGLRRVPTGFRYRLWGHPLRVACGAFPLASVNACGDGPTLHDRLAKASWESGSHVNNDCLRVFAFCRHRFALGSQHFHMQADSILSHRDSFFNCLALRHNPW